jgi:hypothetical protein
MLIQQMFKQTQAKLEKAQVAAVSPMDDSYPVILLGHGTEKHDPDVRQAGSDHQPRQLDHTRHQGQALAADFTPVHNQQRRALCQTMQQCFRKWQEVQLDGHLVIDDPTRKAFHAAFLLGAIRHLPGDSGQVDAFAADDATDQSGQRIQVSGKVAFRLVRIQPTQPVSNSPKSSLIIAHDGSSLGVWNLSCHKTHPFKKSVR